MSPRLYTSMVTVGDIDIYQVTSDPSGSLTARQGSVAVRNSAGNTCLYQNTDGASAWTRMTTQASMSWTFEIEIQPSPDGNGTSWPFRMPVSGIVSGHYRRSAGTQPATSGTYAIFIRKQTPGSFLSTIGVANLATAFDADTWVTIEDPFSDPMAAAIAAGDDLTIQVSTDDPGLTGSGTLRIQLDVAQI